MEASLRREIGALRIDLGAELRRMTVWFPGALVGSLVGGTGVAVGVASLVQACGAYPDGSSDP